MPIGYQYLIGLGVGIIAAMWVYWNTSRITYRETPKRINETFITDPRDLCVICHENMDNNSIQYLPCRHGMHSACFVKYKKSNLRSECPVCRYPF